MYSYGGPTRSIEGLYKTLSIHYDCTVISPKRNLDGSKLDLEYHDKVIFTNSLIPYLLLNGYKYSFIWFNSFFELKLFFLIFLKIFYSFKLIVSPRGQLSNEAIRTSNPKLKSIFIRLIKMFNEQILFHSTYYSETNDINLFFSNSKVFQISNIFDLKYYSNSVTEKKFIFYSRIHKKKGLDILLDSLIDNNLDVKLDIYGFIEDEKYWNICKKKISQKTNIYYKGEISDGDISNLMNKYSFFILPTLNENFGHIIIELLSIGCIPILSKNTNPFDDSTASVFNLNFDLNSKNELKDVIKKVINMDNKEILHLKSLVKPFFENIKKEQEEIKNEYTKLIESFYQS